MSQDNISDIEDRRLMVRFCLDEMGKPPPSADFFRQLTKRPPTQATIQSIQERIKIEKEQHDQDVSKIYDLQAQQLKEMYREQRNVLHGGDYIPPQGSRDRKDIKKSREDKFGTIDYDAWVASFDIYKRTLTFDDTIDSFNQAFFQSQQSLYKKLQELQRQRKEGEDLRNITLPTSFEEFKSITSRDFQVRIARYLDSSGKVAFPPNIVQTPQNLQALQAAYEQDDGFKSHVGELLASIQSSDPRRRK